MNRRGKVIRVSPEVYEALERKRPEFRSWDAILRSLLGLKPRVGKLPSRLEGYVIPGQPKIFTSRAEARGEAIKLALHKGTDIPVPVKVREAL